MNKILYSNHTQLWKEQLLQIQSRIDKVEPVVVEGRLNRMIGLTLEAVGCQAVIGSRCLVKSQSSKPVEAEVVGFSGEKLFLMPTGNIRGIHPDASVIPTHQIYEAHVGDALLGRVLDGRGKPIDGKGPLVTHKTRALTGEPINPLDRKPIHIPLNVGVRAINSLFTVGRGQRMGLFAGSGVGKSMLLGMMTKFTSADVIVVGLIGERGREVKEFIEDILGEAGMQRAVVVAVPADQPPVMRMHGAYQATSIAEHFRDEGKDVLLLMDSLTRFAQAQREIALAIGEPPATKGYPPSVFAQLPQLVERAGNGQEGGGSITAFYTVLTEGDDQQDPIADSARAILDGHIVLSRELAESGHYPAIDVEASISRAMNAVVSDEHLFAAQKFRQTYSVYQQNKDLISVGAYAEGSSPEVDESIRLHSSQQTFLRQDRQEAVSWEDSLNQLADILQNTQAVNEVAETEQTLISNF
ncbi:MAG: flagellar protein export ATPase FliI [Gammaproteobacteria bacterium]|nr:flagellar protein export ATPase FliI [Gammaproteobacteria bacterium]MDH5659658.1 flagellar protein export ATPase FliI [Gammaproteobacteria bacterium]